MSGNDGNSQDEFGANEWLVEEMYNQWKSSPDSVDKEWWPILERYAAQQSTGAAAPMASSPAAPAQSQAPEATVSASTQAETGPLVARTTRIEAKPQPIPAQAPATGSITTIEGESDEDQVTILKGMSKALAANMDASLAVPVATSVRTIPAKLMIDN